MDFGNFPAGFEVWEGLQWIGNGCGLRMDGFSAHFEPSEFISVDFHDFGHFGSDRKPRKCEFGRTRAENTVIPCEKAMATFLKITKKYENRSELDPYSTNRAENQGF